MEVGNFQYQQNTVIFREGEPAKQVYKIEDGDVLCVKFVNKRIVPIMRVKKGESIGHAALTADGKYRYSAIALSYTKVHPHSQASFQVEFRKSPPWMQKLIVNMLKRFEHTADLIAENRVVHSSVIDPAEFTDKMEIEFKKLLGHQAAAAVDPKKK